MIKARFGTDYLKVRMNTAVDSLFLVRMVHKLKMYLLINLTINLGVSVGACLLWTIWFGSKRWDLLLASLLNMRQTLPKENQLRE